MRVKRTILEDGRHYCFCCGVCRLTKPNAAMFSFVVSVKEVPYFYRVRINPEYGDHREFVEEITCRDYEDCSFDDMYYNVDCSFYLTVENISPKYAHIHIKRANSGDCDLNNMNKDQNLRKYLYKIGVENIKNVEKED